MVSESKNKLNKLFISTFIEWIARFSIERFWLIFWQYERPTNWHQFLARRLSVLASSAVDHGLESRSGQTKDDNTGIWCLSAKHSALRRKNKYWWKQVTFWWGDDDICIVPTRRVVCSIISLKQQTALAQSCRPTRRTHYIDSERIYLWS